MVLVEDIISAHKVRQAGFYALPLFGTQIYPRVIASLRALNHPTRLWLDEDQYGVLPPKLNRLQTFLNVPVGFVRSRKDPKKYELGEIKEILNGS